MIIKEVILIKYRTALRLLLLFAFLSVPLFSFSQNNRGADSTQSMTLQKCIDYALKHQPAVNQALIGVSISHKTNQIALAGWLPQVNGSATLTHYFQLPTTLVADTIPGGKPIPTRNGVLNTFLPGVSVSQTIFNPQLFYAANSAQLYIDQAREISDSTKINAVSTVSKSFYNLLLTLEEIDVLKGDTAQFARNVRDTYHQYIGGIVDKTDYEEAVITLNNTKAQLKQQIENVDPQYAVLKQSMGFSPEKQFNVLVDTAQMMKEISFDTTRALQYQKRIEYEQILTDKQLQNQLTDYYRLAFLPNVGAFYNYYYEFENSNFSDLFSAAYPYSYIGLSLNIPIFTGFSRINNIEKSKLQSLVLDWSEINLKSVIYTQYASALSNYKSNLYNWTLLKDNETMAKDAYRIVDLQYRQGTVPYLNVIVAESNLITAEIGYTNALFQVLSSKIDLEKAMGDIH